MPKGTISVRLDQTTLDRLGMIAKATGRSRGTLMTHAIERYAETEAWQVAAIQEAVEDLTHGDAGLVDHSDVSAWLNSWGMPDELESPECSSKGNWSFPAPLISSPTRLPAM